MERSDVQELHYVAPIANLFSILDQGILSFADVERTIHVSFADPEIQRLRDDRQVPGTDGKVVHDFVNLYFNARNAMLFKLVQDGASVVVLAINAKILELPGVHVAIGNAARRTIKPATRGLSLLDKRLVYTRSWKQGEMPCPECGGLGAPACVRKTCTGWIVSSLALEEQTRRKAALFSEVLVPYRVASYWIDRVYCRSEADVAALTGVAHGRAVVANPDLFFDRGSR